MILKGVSHLHTKYSYDGSISLREMKALLIENDIQFAIVTEHSDFIEPVAGEKFIKECHNLSDEKITLIPGFEVPYRDAHILMIGVDHFVKTGECSGEELKKWKEHAKLAIWAHPHKNRYLLYDSIKAVIDGIEVWNSQYDGKKAPRMKVLNSLQGLRARGHDSIAFAGLDFHRTEHLGGPSLMVDTANNENYILDTLKKGDFTIKGEKVQVNSEGRITKGNLHLTRLRSLYSVFVISSLKKVSKFVHSLRIPVSSKLRHAVRKKL